jgi:hypothetical protein
MGLRCRKSVCQCELMEVGGFGGCWGWQGNCVPMCESGASLLGVHSSPIVCPY